MRRILALVAACAMVLAGCSAGSGDHARLCEARKSMYSQFRSAGVLVMRSNDGEGIVGSPAGSGRAPLSIPTLTVAMASTTRQAIELFTFVLAELDLSTDERTKAITSAAVLMEAIEVPAIDLRFDPLDKGCGNV